MLMLLKFLVMAVAALAAKAFQIDQSPTGAEPAKGLFNAPVSHHLADRPEPGGRGEG
jgi:hypothetical protein